MPDNDTTTLYPGTPATVFYVPSRSGGSAHLVIKSKVRGTKNGYTCTCRAGQFGNVCWAQKEVIAQETPEPTEAELDAKMERLFEVGS